MPPYGGTVTLPEVVIRFGRAYPDAVVERLAAEIGQLGLPVRVEDGGPGTQAPDGAGLIALEVPADAGVPLTGDAFRATLEVLLDGAQRRDRRLRAAGEDGEVAVVLTLPDDVRIVVPGPAGPDQSGVLTATVVDGLGAGTLTAGTWAWDPRGRTLHPAP